MSKQDKEKDGGRRSSKLFKNPFSKKNKKESKKADRKANSVCESNPDGVLMRNLSLSEMGDGGYLRPTSEPPRRRRSDTALFPHLRDNHHHREEQSDAVSLTHYSEIPGENGDTSRGATASDFYVSSSTSSGSDSISYGTAAESISSDGSSISYANKHEWDGDQHETTPKSRMFPSRPKASSELDVSVPATYGTSSYANGAKSEANFYESIDHDLDSRPTVPQPRAGSVYQQLGPETAERRPDEGYGGGEVSRNSGGEMSIRRGGGASFPSGGGVSHHSEGRLSHHSGGGLSHHSGGGVSLHSGGGVSLHSDPPEEGPYDDTLAQDFLLTLPASAVENTDQYSYAVTPTPPSHRRSSHVRGGSDQTPTPPLQANLVYETSSPNGSSENVSSRRTTSFPAPANSHRERREITSDPGTGRDLPPPTLPKSYPNPPLPPRTHVKSADLDETNRHSHTHRSDNRLENESNNLGNSEWDHINNRNSTAFKPNEIRPVNAIVQRTQGQYGHIRRELNTAAMLRRNVTPQNHNSTTHHTEDAEDHVPEMHHRRPYSDGQQSRASSDQMRDSGVTDLTDRTSSATGRSMSRCMSAPDATFNGCTFDQCSFSQFSPNFGVYTNCNFTSCKFGSPIPS